MSNFRKKQIMAANGAMFQTRLICVFVIFVIFFVVLVFRVGWIQIIASETYASEAADSQTKDVIIPARRGDILDRNMKELAISTGSYRIFVRVKQDNTNKKEDKKNNEQKSKTVSLLSGTLGKDEAEINEMFNTDKKRVLIAKDVDKNTMDIIRDGINDQEINIIEIEEDIKREYPMGAFASQLLGTVGTDGIGKNGLEYQYNEYLSGIAGRLVGETDVYGNPLSSGKKVNYEQQDGLNLVLTIDENIQYYVEETVAETYKKTKAKKVTAVVMDPNTGDVLANAEYPEFDPNTPGAPTDKKQLKNFKKLSDAEQSEYLNSLWKSSAVCDLYEPGSVFKLVTVASALELGAITPDSHFNCKGYYDVEDRTLKCHIHPLFHGDQNVTQSVVNSCNPAMIQITRRMGYENFYHFIQLFGITDNAGIDYPGEARPIIQDESISGPVGLATMSFGMGLNITPIQMITAVSAIGNEGVMMQPRFVKGFADGNGNMVKEYEPKIVRQVISNETADEVKKMMVEVIKKTKKNFKNIPGYKIGGKTGTSMKLKNGEYTEDIVGSMISMAPIDNPQFVVLVVVDEPQEGEYGADTAGPAVRKITKDTLRYLNIEPEYSKSEKIKIQSNEIVVPEVKGLTFLEAKQLLDEGKIKYIEEGNENKDDAKVVDQYPKPGATIEGNGKVHLYAK